MDSIEQISGTNLGGISSIQIAFVDEIKKFAKHYKQNAIVPVQFKTTFHWITIYFTYETASISESTKPLESGIIFSHDIRLDIPKDRKDLVNALIDWEGRSFIAKYTDNNGITKVVGTLEHPMYLTNTFDTGKRADQFNNHSIRINGDTPNRSIFYDYPTAEDPEIGALILFDSFTDADGALMDTHALEFGVWDEYDFDGLEINNNKLDLYSEGSSYGMYSPIIPTKNVRCKFKLTTSTGLFFAVWVLNNSTNFNSPNGYSITYADIGPYAIWRAKEGATGSFPLNTTSSPLTDCELEIKVQNGEFTIEQNGVNIVSYSGTDIERYNSNAVVVLGTFSTTDADGVLDYFELYALD